MKLPRRKAHYSVPLLKVAQCPASEPNIQMRVQIPFLEGNQPKTEQTEDRY